MVAHDISGGLAMSSTEWLTFGLLVVTAVYAGLTYWLAQTTAKQVWENHRAQIVAALTLHQGGNIMHLVVKNVGQGTTRNCKLSVDQDVHSTITDDTVAGTVAFNRPIHALPASSAWHFALGQPHVWLSSQDRAKFPMLFTITTEYETGGQLVKECHDIDIEALLYGPAIRDDASKFYFDIPQKFDRQSEKLNRILGQIAQSLSASRTQPHPLPYRSWSSSFRRSHERSRR
jgi:hypothetical protein